MTVSILHRTSGIILSLVGLPVLLWWLGALASGPGAYATFAGAATSPIGYLVLIVISWAFFNHMLSGLRHFVLDTGAGYELTANKAWSIAVMVLGVVLTVIFWALIFLI